jgi:adhesin/invasin
MRSPRWFLRLAFSLAGVALLAPNGCSDVSVNVIDVAEVEVSPTSLTLFEDDQEIISAVLRSAGGEILTGRTVQWSTDDPGVAVVSPAGMVRGERRGTTTVRAESEGVVGTAAVTVLQPPTIALSRSEVDFHAVSGADDPPGEEVVVTNEGDGDLLPLLVSVETHGPEWLSASIAHFAAPTTLTVNVAASGLSPGHYEGSVFVASPAAANSPRTLRVLLEVGDPPPRASPVTSTIVAEPSTLVANGSSTATITVVLRDSRGDPMPSGGDGVALSTSAGSLSSVTDNGDGTYTAVFTSSTTAGTATITGSVNGEGMEHSAAVQLLAGPAANVAVTAGNDQTGAVGSTLPVSLQVRVTDAHGNVVGGATVQWSTSNGSASPASGQTGSNGRASTAWTLGTTLGSQSLQASVSGAGSVTFNATAEAGPPTALAITGGNGQTGTVGEALGSPLEVKVTDAYGHPVGAVTVTWSPASGSGSVGSAHSNTGSDGRATTAWTLGTTAGPQALTVSASGVDDSREFTATAEPGPVSATRSSVTAEPAEGILAGRGGVSTVSVILRDLHGNALTGLAGQIQVDLTGQATRTNVVETGPAGTYAFEVRNDVAQLVTVTVTAAGVALEDQPVLEFVECCE